MPLLSAAEAGASDIEPWRLLGDRARLELEERLTTLVGGWREAWGGRTRSVPPQVALSRSSSASEGAGALDLRRALHDARGAALLEVRAVPQRLSRWLGWSEAASTVEDASIDAPIAAEVADAALDDLLRRIGREGGIAARSSVRVASGSPAPRRAFRVGVADRAGDPEDPALDLGLATALIDRLAPRPVPSAAAMSPLRVTPQDLLRELPVPVEVLWGRCRIAAAAWREVVAGDVLLLEPVSRGRGSLRRAGGGRTLAEVAIGASNGRCAVTVEHWDVQGGLRG